MLSPPTAFANQVVPEATIKFPVVVAMLFISFNFPGKFQVTVLVEVVIVKLP